jgi:5-formyltetrahydrofolate cyclo-ligase
MAQSTPEIRALRRSLRALRRSLPHDERQKAERAIGNALRHLKLLRRGHRVAVYLAMPGAPGAIYSCHVSPADGEARCTSYRW